MTTFISINGHTIRSNAKNGTSAPPIRIANCKSDRAPEYCSELAILDRYGARVATLEYSPHKPILHCGARLVLKAEHGVRAKS
jgi:hypothetical protein